MRFTLIVYHCLNTELCAPLHTAYEPTARTGSRPVYEPHIPVCTTSQNGLKLLQGYLSTSEFVGLLDRNSRLLQEQAAVNSGVKGPFR
eukprot:9471772-Pyramimonas_sp.AAC.1